MDPLQERMLVDKLAELAPKARAVLGEMDPGAQNNPISDWLIDVDTLRERAPQQMLEVLCIGADASTQCQSIFGVGHRVIFSGDWSNLFALDPFRQGQAIFGAHVALVSGAQVGEENLKWLAEVLPVLCIAGPDAPALKVQPGNPQWIRSAQPLGVDSRRALVLGALAARLSPVAETLRRGVQSMAAAERTTHELKCRQEAFTANAQRAESSARTQALEAELAALHERLRRVEDARSKALAYLEAVKGADRYWPRELGSNPHTEVAATLLENVKGAVESAYLEISMRGTDIQEFSSHDKVANLADHLYTPFAKLATTDKLEFAANDARVASLVERSHNEAFEFAMSLVRTHLKAQLRHAEDTRSIVLEEFEQDLRSLTEAGRARRVRAVLARTQAVEVPVASILTALRWGYAAVRPHLFMILAVSSLFAVSGTIGADQGIPKVLQRFAFGLGLGVVVALVLFPGRARHERARLRREYIDRNTAAIAEGIKSNVREVIVDVVQGFTNRLKSRFDAIEQSLNSQRETLAKSLKGLVDEQKAASNSLPRTFQTGSTRASTLPNNQRDLERSARTAFADWARSFKVSP